MAVSKGWPTNPGFLEASKLVQLITRINELHLMTQINN